MHSIALGVLLGISGCAGMDMNDTAEGVQFRSIGEYSGRSGQARILLVMYSGEARKGNIKQYADTLGCEMIFAYYYPESTNMDEIPVRQLEAANNYVEAQEILFKGQGVGRWSFASQCLGMIASVTDCLEFPISPNCR